MCSWTKMLAWFLVSFAANFMKLEAGALGSIPAALSYLVDLRNSFLYSFWTFFLRCCLVADLLAGRVFSRQWCLFLQFQCSPSVAHFASVSAFSLPSIPSCPSTHCSFNLILSHFSWIALCRFLVSSMR